MHCIIDKITFSGNSVCFTPVGYTDNKTLSDNINENYESTLGNWVTNNLAALEDGSVLISEFFDIVVYVYVAKTSATVTSGLPLILSTEELV